MAVAAFPLDNEPDVTAAPARRSTDASNLSFPLPLTLTLIGFAIAGAAGVWRIENKVTEITTAMTYEKQLDIERAKLLEQRFQALEAKIEAAGLRNANMALAQEYQKQRGK